MNVEKYVISLDRTPKRKTTFKKYNKEYLKNFKFVSAVDGLKLNIKHINPQLVKPGSVFSKPALGCSFSHYKIWQKIIKFNKPILAIEDDAIFNKNFEIIFEKIMKLLPKDWDICVFAHNYDSCIDIQILPGERILGNHTNNKLTTPILNSFQQTKIINPTIFKLFNCFGTAALITSPAGAKKILSNCYPMDNRLIKIPALGGRLIKSFSIDCLLNSIYKHTNSYIVLPVIALTPNSIENSTIKNI